MAVTTQKQSTLPPSHHNASFTRFKEEKKIRTGEKGEGIELHKK